MNSVSLTPYRKTPSEHSPPTTTTSTKEVRILPQGEISQVHGLVSQPEPAAAVQMLLGQPEAHWLGVCPEAKLPPPLTAGDTDHTAVPCWLPTGFTVASAHPPELKLSQPFLTDKENPPSLPELLRGMQGRLMLPTYEGSHRYLLPEVPRS